MNLLPDEVSTVLRLMMALENQKEQMRFLDEAKGTLAVNWRFSTFRRLKDGGIDGRPTTERGLARPATGAAARLQ